MRGVRKTNLLSKGLRVLAILVIVLSLTPEIPVSAACEEGCSFQGVVCSECKEECGHENLDEQTKTCDNCWAYGYCGENLTWMIKNDTLTISGNGAMKGYTEGIPMWHEDYDEPEYYTYSKVSIGSGVTSIGAYAFSSCSNISSVNIPNTVTSIGENAFERTAIAEINIPQSVKSMGAFAFNCCTNLTNVEIPSSVTTIGNGTFDSCTNLTSVEIPSSVTTIGHGAFYGCTNLTNVEIPDSVTVIGDEVFENCENLTSVSVPCTLDMSYNESIEELIEYRHSGSITAGKDFCTECCEEHTDEEKDCVCDNCPYIFGHTDADTNGICDDCKLYFEPDIEEGYYQIANAGNLLWFAQLVNAGDYDANAILVNNIAINRGTMTVSEQGEVLFGGMEPEYTWIPIGKSSLNEKYTGEFDGNDMTISGLYINNSELDYAGLFGCVGQEGSVFDVCVSDSYMSVKQIVGIMAGANDGSLSNCKNSNCVMIGVATNVGGIAGSNDSNGTITGCYNTASIKGEGRYCGGIVGHNRGSVEKCYNTGAVESLTMDAGGIAGTNNKGSIINCFNTGSVLVSRKSDGNFAGGVSGSNFDGNITNCFNVGTVQSGTYLAGGITGNGGGNVTNCYYIVDCAKNGNGLVQNGIGKDSLSATTADVEGATTSVTTEQLASGEVAYLLNGDQTTITWYQTIGTDAVPVLDDSRKMVYQKLACDGETPVYRNVNEDESHVDINHDGMCDACETFINGVALRGSNLTLNGNIGLNLFFEIDEEVKAEILADETALIRFNLPDGSVREVPATEGVEDTTAVVGTTLYKYPCELTAKQMTDKVKVQFVVAGEVIAEYEYSVADYAAVIIANEESKYSAESIALVKAMLNYGAYAQKNFGYNAENLANAQLAENEKSLASVTVNTFESEKASGMTVDGLGIFAGSSLVLKSETTLKVYFEPAEGVAAEDLTFTVDGEEVTATTSGEYLVISITDIKAQELDKVFAVKVSDGNSEGTFIACVFAYCYSVLSDTTGMFSEELKDVVKALYLYNMAANMYFD